MIKIYLENYSNYPPIWFTPTIQFVPYDNGFSLYFLFLKYGFEVEYKKSNEKRL